MTLATEISEMTRFCEEVDKMKRLQAQILKDTFENVCASFFEETTTISQVAWRQYTDSFNDGDACQFRVREMFAQSGDGDEVESGEWSRKYLAEEGISEKDFTLFQALAEAHANLPDELMREIYGDGFLITVSKEGILVEETLHD